MSLFFVNQCKFNNCGLHFANLPDLLQHIEETHINNDPDFCRNQAQAQPQNIPLSYIWKVFPQLPPKKAKPIASPPEFLIPTATANVPPTAASGGKKTPMSSGGGGGGGPMRRPTVTFSTQRRNETTPTPPQSSSLIASAADQGDSDDSRTSSPECISQPTEVTTERWQNYPTEPKPFGNNQQSGYLCTFPNCSKRYKNYQAAKKHMKEAHFGPQTTNVPVPKSHFCHCGKLFKTLRSLQNHAASAHMNVVNPIGPRMPVKPNTIQVVDAGSIGHQGGIRATASPLQVFGTIYTAKSSPNTTTIDVKAAPSVQSTSQSNRY